MIYIIKPEMFRRTRCPKCYGYIEKDEPTWPDVDGYVEVCQACWEKSSRDKNREKTEEDFHLLTESRIYGSTAISEVSDGFEGSCRVSSEDGQFIAVAPKDEAFRIARYCTTPDGGCDSVVVTEDPGASVTHNTLEDFICD